MGITKRRIAAVINPIAGGGKALRGWKALRELAVARAPVDEFVSEYPGHAMRVARHIAGNGYDVAFAVGGDGTIHEVVNGLLGANGHQGYDGPLFGAIPLGRGNDFARTFGLDCEPAASWGSQNEASEAVRRIDVGLIRPFDGEPTYFVNMCGLGFDADSAAMANRLPRILGGALPYVLGVLAGFIALNNRRLSVCLEGVRTVEGFVQPGWAPVGPGADGSLFLEDDFLLASAGIGRYIGGGIMLLPHANPVDGLLDVLLARRVRRTKLLKILASTFRGGHLGEPEVAYYRAAKATIRGPSGTHIHADGDPVGTGGAEIGVLPGALPVLF